MGQLHEETLGLEPMASEGDELIVYRSSGTSLNVRVRTALFGSSGPRLYLREIGATPSDNGVVERRYRRMVAYERE